mgnify:FL=1
MRTEIRTHATSLLTKEVIIVKSWQIDILSCNVLMTSTAHTQKFSWNMYYKIYTFYETHHYIFRLD